MKRIALLIGIFFLVAINLQAAPMFSENFESGDLSKWTKKLSASGNITSGKIVSDPLPGSSNNVLSFGTTNSWGDIFSLKIFSAGTYLISFDYLGLTQISDLGGYIISDSGGYIGVSESPEGFRGQWLWATGEASGASDVLNDNGEWNSYSFLFTVGYSFRLVLEDFCGSDAIAGNAYFDNIVLYNANPVPEPATMILLGTGLLGLAGLGRKRMLKK